ncbi:N-acetylmuramoyl-L-alanine amidase [Paracoccus suum]|uniref:N-acetylmuramoyl-L-alanine amidase n=1 Tax=Paracoccus suum TaxID=2259340 RepID=A0A344PJE5_9RHOB|nr:N-acetylmuramoyl-L-alanine amidase [Paracoccus suum]
MLLLAAAPARAAPPRDTAPVTLDGAASSVIAEGRPGKPRPLLIELRLNRSAPWRVALLADPVRLVVDLLAPGSGAGDAEVIPGAAEIVPGLRWGPAGPGRMRVVVPLPAPMAVTAATMTDAAPGKTARLAVRLAPVAADLFQPQGHGSALPQLWDLPQPAAVAPPSVRRPGPLRVTLDPGHGGRDPGAVSGNITEAAMMLQVAREVQAALQQRGVEVTLTRPDDRFMPLERRMTAARGAGADAFISLHADALPAGAAAGAAVFTWTREADDRAARELAARHDRDDLLGGMDLAGQDDEVTGVLMDIAQTDTLPRSQNLAQFVLSELALGRIAIRKRPVKGAAFSVLKSPDIPSVLIETGFLSDSADRANLTDPVWRAELSGAIARAVVAWAEDDKLRDPLLRR